MKPRKHNDKLTLAIQAKYSWSQDAVAESLGYKGSSFSRFLTGERPMPKGMKNRMRELLETGTVKSKA